MGSCRYARHASCISGVDPHARVRAATCLLQLKPVWRGEEDGVKLAIQLAAEHLVRSIQAAPSTRLKSKSMPARSRPRRTLTAIARVGNLRRCVQLPRPIPAETSGIRADHCACCDASRYSCRACLSRHGRQTHTHCAKEHVSTGVADRKSTNCGAYTKSPCGRTTAVWSRAEQTQRERPAQHSRGRQRARMKFLSSSQKLIFTLFSALFVFLSYSILRLRTWANRILGRKICTRFQVANANRFDLRESREFGCRSCLLRNLR